MLCKTQTKKRPLLNQRVVVTQRAELAAPLVAGLKKQGTHVLQVPVTQWTPPPNPTRFDKMLAKAKSYDWILFSNQHAVHFFIKRYRELFGNVRGLAGVRLGAYGPMTGRALRKSRLKPTSIATDHKTKLILQSITKTGSVKGQRFLIIQGNPKRVTEKVPQALKKLGARVDVLQGYDVKVNTQDLTGDADDLLKNGADWILFSSALAIEHFDRRFNIKKLLKRFPNIRLALHK